MRFSAVLGAIALLSVASAAPLRRDVDVETVTQIDIVVEMVTATVWVDPTGAAYVDAYTSPTTTTTSTPLVEYHAPEPTSTTSTVPAPTTLSTTQAPVPAPTTSSTTIPAPVPVTTSTTTSAPATTSVYVAPVAASTTQESATSAVATQASATSASSSSSGTTYTGDITYYDVGLGSCGITNTDSEMVVAMSAALMNKATMCGKTITLSYGGLTQTATVVDTCPGCASGSLDLSPTLFKAIAPNGDGRVHGVNWWFN